MPTTHICSLCGYAYDDSCGDDTQEIQPGTTFAELPNGWTCPVCGANKDQFEKI